VIHRKSSVALCDCLCDAPWSIDLRGEITSLPEKKNNFWRSGRIAFIGYMLRSYRIFLLPSYQSIFSQRRRAYNVTRPLSLSGRASEIKKVRICIFPNAFAMLRSTMHIPHVLLLNIKFWRKMPLLSLFSTWMWVREDVIGKYKTFKKAV